LIIVDDGSSDPLTVGLLNRLEASGVQVLHQSNEGQAAAAMTGVLAASAPYVMRFDADDILEPGALSDLADQLDRLPAAAAAWGDVQTFGLTTFRIPGIPALDPWLVTHVNCVTGSGNLFRRSVLLEVGGWQLREGYEDWDVWMAIAERGYSAIHVPRVAFRHRRDAGGRLVGWLPETDRYYEVLRARHTALFSMRAANRRRSPSPFALKISIRVVEALPGVSRLTKIHLCELVTRLLWGGGLRATAAMALQAAQIRLRSSVGARHT
jgi:glycosyltransferase involved in cell wall biosynthesis